MSEIITSIAERDALPVGSIVTDAYAATCIRARQSEPPMPSDWVRVTTAVNGHEHHHSPYLPADVERVGWSGWPSEPDGGPDQPPRALPSVEDVARIKAEARDEVLNQIWWLHAAKDGLALNPICDCIESPCELAELLGRIDANPPTISAADHWTDCSTCGQPWSSHRLTCPEGSDR